MTLDNTAYARAKNRSFALTLKGETVVRGNSGTPNSMERAADIFADQRGPQRDEQAERIAELERLAGKQALEIAILKHILKLVTYNVDVIEAQSLDRVSMSWRPRILKWEHRIPQL